MEEKNFFPNTKDYTELKPNVQYSNYTMFTASRYELRNWYKNTAS